MNATPIIQELSRNREVFKTLLTGLTDQEYLWKPKPEKWCLLEIICHLYDEEREDFRARTKHLLENSKEPFISIDPTGWVLVREYIKQDFTYTLNKFLRERNQSVEWLQSLHSPKWDNTYFHPKLGKMTAKLFLSNWLAHDYIHIRQILKIKFGYLQQLSNETLDYAGVW